MLKLPNFSDKKTPNLKLNRKCYMVTLPSISPVKMFCSSRQHSRSSRQQMPDPLASKRAPSEVQCGVSSKYLTEGSKIVSCRHILTGLSSISYWVIPEKIQPPPPPPNEWHAGNSRGRGGRRLWKSWQEGGLDLKIFFGGHFHLDLLGLWLCKTSLIGLKKPVVSWRINCCRFMC